eukprot:m.1270588 g.1270588  ORF g.1270588 m.1270588 type:complete len:531 (-) comp24749_c0_seq42:2572-4164(-)
MPPKKPVASFPSWYDEFDRDLSQAHDGSPEEIVPIKRAHAQTSEQDRKKQSLDRICDGDIPSTTLQLNCVHGDHPDARFASSVCGRFDRYAPFASPKNFSTDSHHAAFIDALYVDQDRVARLELPTSSSLDILQFLHSDGKPRLLIGQCSKTGPATTRSGVADSLKDHIFPSAAGWACSRARTIEDKEYEAQKISSNPNKPIIDVLDQLQSSYDITQDHLANIKIKNLKHVIAQLKKLQSWVGDMTDRELQEKIRGIGAKTLEKIREAESTHTLERLRSINTPEFEAKKLFETVWGIGPNDAAWLASQKFRTINDLRNNRNLLNHTQQMGLDYYEHILQRIPREEVTKIGAAVKTAVQRMCPDVICIVCGSYRRGAATCGDIDILLTHPQLDNSSVKQVLGRFVREQLDNGFLTVTLTGSGDSMDKFMGLCKLPGYTIHRRIDIIAIPHEELPFALLYFTGSAYLNRSMRLKARKMGMSLSQHGLKDGCLWNSRQIKICEGEFIRGLNSEAAIFEKLGLPFLEPGDRNHG